MSENILIIGSNGYVGSRLLDYLKDKNFLVTGVGSRNDDYKNLDSNYLKNFSTIILLAGHSSVQMCQGELHSPWNNNVRNFDHLVKKLDRDQKLIYASSSSVYGNKGGKLFTEEDINTQFINNYDLTKVTLDLLALNYIKQGSKIIGLRFGTVNGSSNIIRRDLMLNSMVYTALNDRVIKVNNKNVSRPILSLNDLCRSICAILQNTFQVGIYNLATFNLNVNSMSKIVSVITDAPIIDNGDFPGIYNFETSTEKFCNSFNFTFNDKVENLVKEIIACYQNPKTKIVIRSEYFKYD